MSCLADDIWERTHKTVQLPRYMEATRIYCMCVARTTQHQFGSLWPPAESTRSRGGSSSTEPGNQNSIRVRSRNVGGTWSDLGIVECRHLLYLQKHHRDSHYSSYTIQDFLLPDKIEKKNWLLNLMSLMNLIFSPGQWQSNLKCRHPRASPIIGYTN